MLDVVLPIKEEAKVDTPAEPVAGLTQSEIDSSINRRLIPVNLITVGRSVKLRDVFVVSGAVAVSTTVTTVTASTVSTTETNLATFTFLKNEWHVGMVVKITAFGTFTGTAVPSATWRIGGGTAPTTEWNSMVATQNVTNAPWDLTWYGIIKTVGASGTLEAQMRGSTNNTDRNDPNTSTVSIDTTANLVLALTLQWSANTAANSVTIRQFIVEILN